MTEATQAFTDGWWSRARRWPINHGRVGGTIKPKCAVVHTTDMEPGSMAALLRAWRDKIGVGSGAHFLIGKQATGWDELTPTGGIVQLAPITRNGNHAGGSPAHGWYRVDGNAVHPNLVAVGIEVDNAGLLRRAPDGTWLHRDSGHTIPTPDVFVDDHGRGWERVTDYQFQATGELLDALRAVLSGFGAAKVSVTPNGEYAANGEPWAALPGVLEVGHCTLDPTQKTDPGPQFMAWLRARAAA